MDFLRWPYQFLEFYRPSKHSKLRRGSTHLICGDRRGSDEGCNWCLCNHPIGGDAIWRGVEAMEANKKKIKTWKVDCTHSSPDVTTRTGENEPFVTLCFPTTQFYSRNCWQNGSDIIKAVMETINTAASLCAASSKSSKNETWHCTGVNIMLQRSLLRCYA